jgi:hypothetical protein
MRSNRRSRDTRSPPRRCSPHFLTARKYTNNGAASQRGSRVDYGPFKNTEAFQENPVRIHFENNFPQCVFEKASKQIEVSHWGNIAIEEKYFIENRGAELAGEYSRVDFNEQTQAFNGKSALKELKAKYPIHTWGMYYTDDIGNITTSRAFRNVPRPPSQPGQDPVRGPHHRAPIRDLRRLEDQLVPPSLFHRAGSWATTSRRTTTSSRRRASQTPTI